MAADRVHQLVQVDFRDGRPADAVRGLLQLVDDINRRLGQDDAEGVAMLMTSAAVLLQRAATPDDPVDKAFFVEIASVCFDSALILSAREEAGRETRQ